MNFIKMRNSEYENYLRIYLQKWHSYTIAMGGIDRITLFCLNYKSVCFLFDFTWRNNRVFHDKQIWQKYNPIFKYYYLNDKNKGYLIFPALARLCGFHQIINTYYSKE